MNDWVVEYEPVIRPYLSLLDAESKLHADDRLADLGLDSMGTVGLLIEMEDTFSISIPDELLTTDIFQTPATLHRVIEGLRHPGSA